MTSGNRVPMRISLPTAAFLFLTPKPRVGQLVLLRWCVTHDIVMKTNVLYVIIKYTIKYIFKSPLLSNSPQKSVTCTVSAIPFNTSMCHLDFSVRLTDKALKAQILVQGYAANHRQGQD